MKAPRSSKPRARSPASAALVQEPLGGAPVDRSGDRRFAEVVALVEAARRRAYQAVNTELVAHD